MKRLIIATLVVLSVFAAIIFAVWVTGRNVYEIDQPITASPADCGDGTRLAVIGDYARPVSPKPMSPR